MTQRTLIPAILFTLASMTATSSAMARDSIEVVALQPYILFQPLLLSAMVALAAKRLPRLKPPALAAA